MSQQDTCSVSNHLRMYVTELLIVFSLERIMSLASSQRCCQWLTLLLRWTHLTFTSAELSQTKILSRKVASRWMLPVRYKQSNSTTMGRMAYSAQLPVPFHDLFFIAHRTTSFVGERWQRSRVGCARPSHICVVSMLPHHDWPLSRLVGHVRPLS